MNNSNIEPLPLNQAFYSKPSISVDLFNIPLDYQVILSYSLDNVASAPDFHIQDYYEIIVHIKSGRNFFADGSIIVADFGDFLLFPPNLLHKGIDVSKKTYERFYMFINPELLELLPDGKRIIDAFRNRMIRFDSNTQDQLLNGLMPLKKICRLPGLKNATDEENLLKLRTHIYRIFCEIALYKTNTVIQTQIKLPPILNEILKYIDENYSTIATANDISAHFGISNSYMSRLFRNWLKTTPYQYLMSIRFIEAKRLLKSGASVTEACFSSGFMDLSHFIEQFRRRFGVTPKKWQE